MFLLKMDALQDVVKTTFAIGLTWISLAFAPAQGQTDILIGQSAGFTGGQAEYSNDVKLGIEAALLSVNKTGGIGGRKLRLVTADDGGKRDAVLANTKKLVETDNVVALIGYTSGAGTEASLDYISKAKIPVLSPATGNMGIRAKLNPYLFHTRAGYGEEMAKISAYVAPFGITKVALAYLDDVGPANLKCMQDALAKHQLTAVATVGLNRNALEFTAQIDTIIKAQPQLVVFISNAKPIAMIVKGLRERGYGGQIATSSFAGSRVVADLKEHARGLIMIQVLPQPRKDFMQFQKDFHAGVAALAPQTKPNYTMLEGFIAGRVLVEGLKRSAANPGRAQLASALEGMGDLDFAGYRIRFDKDNHDGSRFVELGIVSASGDLLF